MLHHQLQQLQRFDIGAAQKELQPVEIDMIERGAAVAADADAQRADRAALAQPHLPQRNIRRHAAQFDLFDLQRQQRHLVRRGVAAGDAVFLQQLAVHHGAARHAEAAIDVPFFAVGMQLGDRHRRRRRQITGRDHLQ